MDEHNKPKHEWRVKADPRAALERHVIHLKALGNENSRLNTPAEERARLEETLKRDIETGAVRIDQNGEPQINRRPEGTRRAPNARPRGHDSFSHELRIDIRTD